MKWFAFWIINHIARDDCSEWALAMRREFEELESGYLGWVLGCIGALCVKDLRDNAAYLIAIILSAYFMVVHYPILVGQLMFYDEKLYLDYFFMFDHFGQIPLALALGFWRPTRAFTIMLLGGFLGYTVGGILFVMHSFDGSLWEWLGGGVSYQVIGRGGENAALATGIDLVVWYLAALAGGRLRLRQTDASIETI